MAQPREVFHAALAGMAGAVVVNLLHEITRQITPAAPRMDIVGMRAMAGLSNAMGLEPPDHLRTATFGADLIANSLYYSLVGIAGPERALSVGAGLGSAAGIGGVVLPPPMNLGDEEVNRSGATQALVVGMYLAGGLVAGATYRALSSGSSTHEESYDALDSQSWLP